ncbi:UvrD-helicase domain-containing protein, partial [Paenibacillus xylanexedens]|uniref:UvrD-helicase domain-containing protein n=1 Tax=Paenibacillus xylanexedens TaxID=528191 RepID=UPI001C92C910
FEPKPVHPIMSTAKNQLISPHQYDNQPPHYFQGILPNLYTIYQNPLTPNNSLHFHDLIIATIQLFEELPQLL